MKKITILSLLVGVFANSYAQNVETTNFNSPFGITIADGFMYVAETATNAISRYDLADLSATPVAIVENTAVGADVSFYEGEMYIANFDQNATGFVSKFDPTDAAPATTENVTNTTGQTIFLDIENDFLYLAHRDVGNVTRVDVTDASPSEEIIGLVEGAYGISVDNGKMILSTNGSANNGLWLQEDVEDSLNLIQMKAGTILGVYLNGNFAYYWDQDLAQLERIDITDGTYTPTVLFSYAGTGIYGITQDGDMLYTADLGGDILSFDLSTLSVDDTSFANTISLYPNPTQDNITVNTSRSISELNVVITNVAGQKVLSTQVEGVNNTIATRNLSAGIYFASISSDAGETVIKFVKN